MLFKHWFASPLLTFINPRGVAEREWSHSHPDGTRGQFNEYFKNLSPEKRQVISMWLLKATLLTMCGRNTKRPLKLRKLQRRPSPLPIHQPEKR
jgi:hypothetical protein